MDPDIPAARPSALRAPARRLALAAVVVLTATVIAIGALSTRSGSSAWIVGLAALLVGTALVTALAGPPWDRDVVALAVATVVIGVSSGLVRPRTEVTLTDRATTVIGGGGGDIVSRLDVWWLGVVAGVALLVVGAVGVLRRPRAPGSGLPALAGLAALSTGLIALTALLRDIVVGSWVEGRPPRRAGRRIPPPARPAPTCAADLWLRAADEESASVGAFTDLADQLDALGAPADLVARARRAARDEIRHARQCHEISALVSAATSSPGSLPPAAPRGPVEPPVRTPKVRARGSLVDIRPARSRPMGLLRRVELARLALESLVDGAAGEGFAAARLRAGAGTVRSPEVAARLERMAADEARHAALACAVVRWCAEESPRLVRGAVRSAVRRLPARARWPEERDALSAADLRAAGLPDRVTAQRLWARARRDVATWVETELDAPRRPGRAA